MIPTRVYEETLLQFFAPVRTYLTDPSVSEVMINGPDQIFIERNGLLELTTAKFSSEAAMLAALRNAAQFVGKHVDDLNPILEGRLPDGSRLQGLLRPIATTGPYVSIRRFFQSKLTLAHLVETGSLSPLAAETLTTLVKSKLNVIVAGGTGTGKTSLLNLLTSFIPQGERVGVIEDSKEIQVQHPHVFQLEARKPDEEGRGEVTIRDLFRASLRMRPDRVIIGEIRGGEALDIVQAMVSGHGGCMGTLHASHPRDTLTRLETMAMMSDIEMPLVALRLQIASGVNLIVQVGREPSGRRVITHITEVLGYDAERGKYEISDVFRREYTGSGSSLESQLVPTGAPLRCEEAVIEHGHQLPLALRDAMALHRARS
ncbi:MAG TPA: ATPase, T2SS/T4P/T4SS family [Polyangiaceae bacterium]|nr:ATPase, T2SS/T4P/T4SS family [Polyangiaceae bacterium]